MKARLILGVLPLMMACSGTLPGREPPPKPFTGTKWLLVTERRPAGEPPYLEFGDGAVTGYSGCNRIMGTYEQDGSSLAMNPGRMRFDPCTGAVAAQETAVLAGFALVASFTADGQLLLKGADGSTLLTYDPTLTELAGTE